MKKLIACLLLAMLLPTLALADVKIAEVEKDKEYIVKLEEMAHLYPPSDKATRLYYVAQGCATDGENGYFILINKVTSKGSVWKRTLTDFSEVSTVYKLPVDHGNDAAYNSKKHQLVVVNNDPNKDTLTIINPDTLELIEQVKLPYKAYAISYNAAKNQFLIGISGSFDSYITDGEFNIIKRIPGIDTGLTKQGMDSDDTYIYFPQWDSDKDENFIIVYD